MACTEDAPLARTASGARSPAPLGGGANTATDVGNTHFFFSGVPLPTNTAAAQSLYQGKATSADAGLSVQYPWISYRATACRYTAAATPIGRSRSCRYLPQRLTHGNFDFFQPGHSGNNKIAVAGSPYGITVDAVANDYVVFKSSSGDPDPQETWQEFSDNISLSAVMTQKDSNAEDVSWYIAEEDERTSSRWG